MPLGRTSTHEPSVNSSLNPSFVTTSSTAVLGALETAIPDAVAGATVEEVGTTDGFKLLLTDGSWLLVRPSGTEPKLRVYAEAGTDARVEELLAAGTDLVEPLV